MLLSDLLFQEDVLSQVYLCLFLLVQELSRESVKTFINNLRGFKYVRLCVRVDPLTRKKREQKKEYYNNEVQIIRK